MTTVGVLAGLGVQEAGVIWFDAHPDFDTPDERADGTSMAWVQPC